MAVDTRPKRESALGFMMPWLLPMPVPDGGGAATEGERQQLQHSYNGIPAGAPAGAPTVTSIPFFSRVFQSRALAGGVV